jgi:hypothetical protein
MGNAYIVGAVRTPGGKKRWKVKKLASFRSRSFSFR